MQLVAKMLTGEVMATTRTWLAVISAADTASEATWPNQVPPSTGFTLHPARVMDIADITGPTLMDTLPRLRRHAVSTTLFHSHHLLISR